MFLTVLMWRKFACLMSTDTSIPTHKDWCDGDINTTRLLKQDIIFIQMFVTSALWLFGCHQVDK